MSKDSLINKYRPDTFKKVIGQDHITRSYKTVLDDGTSHSFLFFGPGGTGKTTLARLGAHHLGATERNIIDVDAATNSGVDEVRALTEGMKYRVLGKKGSVKAYIIDECHRLSGNAWDALLKPIEEPPEWVFWFLCTTNLDKVPNTIRTRCTRYTLKPVPTDVLIDYLGMVCDGEGFDTTDQVLQLCARRANGSPRQALSNLAVAYPAKDRAEAVRLIDNLDEEAQGTGFKLAKAIADGWSWEKIQPIVASMKEAEENPEGVRHTVREYFTTVAIRTKDQKGICACLKVLDAFSEPFNSADGFTPLIIALGRAMFAV